MKNSKKLLGISLLAASGILALASCGVNDSSTKESSNSSVKESSSSSVSSESSSSSIETSSSSSGSETRTSYSVTFQPDANHPNTTFTLYNNISSMQTVADGGQIKVGAIFAVEIDDGTTNNSTVKGVKANGIAMTAQSTYLYKFQMPEEDVIITVEYDNPEAEFTLTYNADSKHPGTYVTFYDGNMIDGNANEISSAKKGQTVYVMTSYDVDKDILDGIYFNGNKATIVDPTYSWMLVSFTMPEENVVITVAYQGTASASYSLEYKEDAKHPNTFVSFAKSIDDIMNGNSIVSANAGDLVYVYVQNMDDDNPTAGVYYNGTLATKDTSYGWMVSTFTMPEENVTITVTYENSDTDETYTHTLTYTTDTAHPTTTVKFAKSYSQAINESFSSISGANKDDTIYVYISGQEEIITGVYYNGTLATQYSASGYGWSLVTFTMPDADVTLTITYQVKTTSNN